MGETYMDQETTPQQEQTPVEPQATPEQPQVETQEPQVENHEQDAPQVDQEAVTEEQPTEETAPEQPTQETQTDEPQAQAPEQEVNQSEENFEIPEIPQVKPLTQDDLKVNPETGEVDVNALLGTFNERIAQAVEVSTTQATTQVDLKNKYEKSWDEADAAFPELKQDKKLRDMVYAIHADSATRGGKYLSPKSAAEQLFSLKNKSKAEGIQAANESTTIQASARLETASNNSGVSVNKDLQERLNSDDRQVAEEARREKLAQLLKAGKI